MDRWACIDAFDFPLQVLLSQRPEWIDHPTAVLDRDHPQGRIIDLNHRALTERLRPNMRYGEALALLPYLRAATVDKADLKNKSASMAATLDDFSPRVERDDDHLGLFWIDVSGLSHIYPTWPDLVVPLRDRLREEHDLYVAIVIGFTRFGTFAVTRSNGHSGVFESPESERKAAEKVPLHKLDFPPRALEMTNRLGIDTVDEFLALPAEGLRRRIGNYAFRLYRRARGDLCEPLSPFRLTEAASKKDNLDHAETDSTRLLFLIKKNLHTLLNTLEKNGEKLVRLTLVLHRRQGAPIEASICPADPTEDALLLTDLIRLRLDTLPIASGITDIDLTAHGHQTSTEQMHLFASTPSRDIGAANQALARLRAEFGADSVLGVTLRDGHLPESRFDLTPLDRLKLPDVQEPSANSAVRRFFPSPIGLHHRPHTSIRAGPHTISGGWWVREIHRDYHFVETNNHRLLWIFYDHYRQRWYSHGEF